MGSETSPGLGGDAGSLGSETGAREADSNIPAAVGGPEGLPLDNGVILVHAAGAPSFRLCFENDPDSLPQPDAKVMPEANVVGVELGSAVRIPPLKGAPGVVRMYEEQLIRALYTEIGKGLTCGQLAASPTTRGFSVALNAIDTDLSRGVHLMVVRGCTVAVPDRPYTAAECGAGYVPGTHNLSVAVTTLAGAARDVATELPVQVIHLSQALESARGGKRSLDIEFGDFSGANDANIQPVATSPALFGAAEPVSPAKLAYAPTDIQSYGIKGFRVSLGPSPTDITPTPVLTQTLASVQKLSSPRDVPPTYYAKASNYVLLLLGEPSPKLDDGGLDDDPRRALHLLAVPVIDPQGDAGADAAPDGTAAANAPDAN